MRVSLRIPHVGGDSLAAALLTLQVLNEQWLREHDAPPLYQSGIRYQPERASEDWLTWPDLLRLGVGDCEDLAAARASELRVTGEDPAARAVAYRSGPALWHAVVLRGSGRVEDPSLRLGMRAHRGTLPQGAAWRR